MKAVTVYLNPLNSLLLSALANFTGVSLLVCVSVVFVLALVMLKPLHLVFIFSKPNLVQTSHAFA